MPRDPGPRKPKRVELNVMSETGTLPPSPPAARAERARSPGARKEDWIGDHLRQVYDEALKEAIPQRMLDLLDALDEVEPAKKDQRR